LTGGVVGKAETSKKVQWEGRMTEKSEEEEPRNKGVPARSGEEQKKVRGGA